jgi:DNA (cytosine-5)-methyltransferase 1
MTAAARVIRAADLFCGAGGTSTGLAHACRDLGLGLDLVAVNHWDVAIRTHTANHPFARHLCSDLDTVSPRTAVPSGRLDLMVASPECTHHSNARGGRPVTDQKRASAWHVLRWAEAIYVDNLLVENVREFRDWGPVGVGGRPMKTHKGETYRAFLAALSSLGYRVEDRILNAADYGDPTTRERLFILARRGNHRISWPEPSHSENPGLHRKTEQWKAAREIIDWALPSQSIFARKRPLSPATMNRIIAGLRRFGGPQLEPFLVILRGTGTARSIERPVPAVTAQGQHLGLCEPFLLQQQSGGAPRATSRPVPTVAAKDRLGLVTAETDGAVLDVHFRMLQPHELARAMSFDDGYQIAGNQEQRVRQIGNAVPVNLARALCRALLE